MHFNEFYDWFKTQSELKKIFFSDNIQFLKKSLLSFEISTY